MRVTSQTLKTSLTGPRPNRSITLAWSILSEDYEPENLCENIGNQYLARRDSFSHSDSPPVAAHIDTTGRRSTRCAGAFRRRFGELVTTTRNKIGAVSTATLPEIFLC
jgi:hypothetical protein